MVILARLGQENKGYSLFFEHKKINWLYYFSTSLGVLRLFSSQQDSAGIFYALWHTYGVRLHDLLLNLFILSYFTNPSRSSCRSCSLPVEMR